MTRDNRDRFTFPKAVANARPAPAPFGQWNGDQFDFASPQHEREWRSQAYRQSVRADRWHMQAPVDRHTQALLDGMPELGGGRFFRGPDGKHRRITAEQREDPAVQDIRRRAFTDLARSGITWDELGAYDPDQPHPGEDEAVALRAAQPAAKSQPESQAASTVAPDKKQGMGAAPRPADAVTRVAGDLNLGLGNLSDPWDRRSAVVAPRDILVASNDKAGAAAPALKGILAEPEPASPGRPMPGLQQRRDFVEGLVGRPANDNAKPATHNNAAVLPADGKVVGQAQPSIAIKPNTGGGMSAEDIAEAEYMNGLFNWRRQGKPAPAPKAYAIHAITDEGRFSYLEEMKDEWSRLVEAHPEEILKSMTGEVEKLSHAAQQDFFTAFHREPSAQELAEINDTAEKVVFAPAEHWTDAAKSPNHRGGEKPYLDILSEPRISADEALSIVGDVLNTAIEAHKRWGKPGNETTQRHVPELAKKMIEELERCGIEIAKDQLKFEKQIKISKSNKGARWSDFRVEFEVDGKIFALDVNHAAYLLSRYRRTPGEQAAFSDIVSFRELRANGGEFADHEGAVISFPKMNKQQTEEEYRRQMDDFVKKLIDCKAPVKVRITNPYDVKIITKKVPASANDK